MQALLREELRHLSQLSKPLPGYSMRACTSVLPAQLAVCDTALHAFTQALLREELRHLSQLSKSLPGYSVQLVGHSLGAGVAALAAYMINTR
jgi:tRNA isopentenyl-2-thiomethyl-A-37 hydroxylase MiaE